MFDIEPMDNAGRTTIRVYFPTTSIVSLLYVLPDGASAEIAVIDNEGILGISLSWAGKPRPTVR